MIVKSKMRTLGSGKTGTRTVMAASSEDAVKKAWISDARLYVKVFGKDKARRFLADTEYFTA